MVDSDEVLACTPVPLDLTRFNHDAFLPYDCTVTYIQQVMTAEAVLSDAQPQYIGYV
ncbi:MAG: hypothetical protein OHK0023_28610 [Anaerolineae bacterium]